jgi:hypothetical protein
MEDLRFEPPVNRLGQRIVVAVADTANRRFDPRRGQALRLADGQGLAAPVAVMNQSHCLGWTAFMDRLFQGIQDETRVRRGADAPADNAPGISIDDDGDIDEPLPGGHVGESADPEPVRRGSPERPVHLIQGAWGLRDRRLVRLAADNALNPHVLHQPRDRAASDIEALAAHRMPDLAHAIDAPVLLERLAR